MKANKFPIEYIASQIEFAFRIQALTGGSLHDIFIEYTDLYHTLTNIKYGKNEEGGTFDPKWTSYLEKISKYENTIKISELTYAQFLNESFSQIEIGNVQEEDDLKIFGSFGLSYNEYNREKRRYKFHFYPQRLGLLEKDPSKRVGDLASVNLNKRKTEVEELLKFTKHNNLTNMKYLVSSTWLQNIPNYQYLFPPKYSHNENRTLERDSHLGLWGQFIKWDLSRNVEIYNEFISNLKAAKTMDEVLNSFPYQVYKVKIPLKEMYEYYNIK